MDKYFNIWDQKHESNILQNLIIKKYIIRFKTKYTRGKIKLASKCQQNINKRIGTKKKFQYILN